MLNAIQKQALEATVQFWLQDIVEDKPREKAILGLRAISDDEIYHANLIDFNEYGSRISIDKIRELIKHPCPQNRAVGSPYLGQDPGMVVWRNQHTHQVEREPKGLLGLTALNDARTEVVTKEDVLNHLNVLTEQYLKELSVSASQSEVKEDISSPHSNPSFFKLSSETLLQKAQEFLVARYFAEALPYLNQLVDKAPDHAEYSFLRGKALAALGRRDQALVDFNRALRFRKKHAQTLVERGYTLENLHDIQGAIRDYTLAVDYQPEHAFAHCQLGGLLMDTGRFEEGEAHYERSLQIKNDDPHIYRSRGERLLMRERYVEAIADFSHSLHLQPDQRRVKAMKAEAERLQHAAFVAAPAVRR